MRVGRIPICMSICGSWVMPSLISGICLIEIPLSDVRLPLKLLSEVTLPLKSLLVVMVGSSVIAMEVSRPPETVVLIV